MTSNTFKDIQKQQQKIQDMLEPKTLQYLKENLGIASSISKKIQPTLVIQKKAFEQLSPALGILQKYNGNANSLSVVQPLSNKYLTEIGTLFQTRNRFLTNISPGLDIVKRHQRLFETYNNLNITKEISKLNVSSKTLTAISSSFYSALGHNSIEEIDVTGLDELTVEKLDDSSEQLWNVKPKTTIEKKHLSDLTVDEFEVLIGKSMTKVKTFSIAAFLYQVYSEYVNDAARVLIEVVFAFSLTFITGQYNAEVKIAIHDTIQESMIVKDVRKAITKYVKVNPTDQVAFLRKESFLRQGASRNSPIVSNNKISTNIVLTIYERRNNWLKIEVNTGEEAGQIGWIEESKVIKFKKIE